MASLPTYTILITSPLSPQQATDVLAVIPGPVTAVDVAFNPEILPVADKPVISSTNLNQASAEIHAWARSKGWYEPAKSFGEAMVMVHSEISEAIEEFRVGHPYTETYFSHPGCETKLNPTGACTCTPKPEGIPTELADVIIRICDTAAFYGIDLDEAIRVKREYNETRGFRHGDKAL